MTRITQWLKWNPRISRPTMVAGVLESKGGAFNTQPMFLKGVLAVTAEAVLTGEVVLTAGIWARKKD